MEPGPHQGSDRLSIDTTANHDTVVYLADSDFDNPEALYKAFGDQLGCDGSDPEAVWKAIGAGKPGHVAMPVFKSLIEVRREAMARSAKIYTSYEKLHEILNRHEFKIQKRWLKKTRTQRLKIMTNAWPNMPATHRPDFDALRKESDSDREKGTKYRESFMWPQINQEDLLKTKSLPLLLNARGRYPPSHFAAADRNTMHFGVLMKAINPIFLDRHTMILNGFDRNSMDYGKLMNWNEHPDAFKWMNKQKQFYPGKGLLVLEAQERLLEFLVQCCMTILHDIPESELTSQQFTILPEPQFKPENEISGFDSLGVMAAEAPYRVPAQLNFHLIDSLLSARASAAEDHIWSLREDPEYFSRTILKVKDHHPRVLKDTNGHDHPLLRRGGHKRFWAAILHTVVSDAYLDLEAFSELSNQAKRLSVLQKQYADDISPTNDLPEEYLVALLRFRYYLGRAANGQSQPFKSRFMASPPLRNRVIRLPPSHSHPKVDMVISKPDYKWDDSEKQLIWLLNTLWDDGDLLYVIGRPMILDELDRLLQSKTHIRDLFSSYVTVTVGDLSILSQCSNQLNLYQPWATSWHFDMNKHEEGIAKEFRERTKPWAMIFHALDETNIPSEAVDFGDPSSGHFTYPVHKRRTKENVEAMRQAEGNLDAFWEAMDQVLSAKAADLKDTAVRNLLSKPHILQRTPEWVEPKLPAVARDKVDYANIYNSSQLIPHISSDAPAKIIIQPKIKKKLRPSPVSAPLPVEEDPVSPLPNLTDNQPIFPVDGRAMKVFRTLFFNPEVTSTPGEIPWNDFLHAMASVGFTIMKLYGSVWQFEPTNLDVERNIQFHEPHPRGKLPLTVARRYGRRLNKTYGWVAGIFVLEEKSTQQAPT